MTFDVYKTLDEYQRIYFLRSNGIVISMKIYDCRHYYAFLCTPDKDYIARDRSSLFEYLELVYLLYYRGEINV